MTDVHQTTATLVLGENLEGRFFVRTASQDLVVELYKPQGRTVELAVEAGLYEVRLERAKESLLARTEITDGSRVVLDPRQFGQAAPAEPTVRRGDIAPPRLAVAGRNRFELVIGMWRAGTDGATVTAGSASDMMGGLAYTHYIREDLAMTLSILGVGFESGATISREGVSTGSVGAVATLIGARWNPLKGDHAHQVFKPFITGSLGPISGLADGSFVSSHGSVTAGSSTKTTLGGHFGGGVDTHVARSFSIGLDVGYNAMMNFEQPVGVHNNFNGLQVAVGLGWLFGKGQ